MKPIIHVLILLFSLSFVNSQNKSSPYEWQWKRNGIWTGTALAGNALGLYFIVNKDGLTGLSNSITLKVRCCTNPKCFIYKL